MASSDKNTSLCLLPPKRPKRTNFEQCILCHTNTGEHSRKPQAASIRTLIAALEARDDDVLHRLKQDIDNLFELPVRWHSSCYGSCTSVHNLKYATPQRAETSLTAPNNSAIETPRTSRSQTPPMDWSSCIFCKKIHKKVK